MVIYYYWYILAALVGVITYYYIIWKHKYSYWTSRLIQGPIPVPVYGNLLTPILTPKPEVELHWYKKFGKVYGLYYFDEPRLTVADPTIVQQILVKDFHLFRNRSNVRIKHKIFSKNLFRSVDEDWKRIRAMASPTFTSGKLRKMYKIIANCCDDFVQNLDKHITDGKQQVELKKLMGCLTMDVISRCAFAIKTNTSDPNNQFTLRAHRMLNATFWTGVMNVLLPFWVQTCRIIKWLMGSEVGDKEFFVDIPRALMAERRKSSQKTVDFLQLLMGVKGGVNGKKLWEVTDDDNSDELVDADAKQRAKLTEDEILAQCFLFFIAGYETTATTLSFCIYELALNPDIQERLVEEVLQAFNEKGDIDYELLLGLPFLDSVISETLRNYPPVVRLERMAGEDVVLKSDDGTTVKVEKGVVIEIPVYAIHHEPDYYTDPFEFRPDRFMADNCKTIKPYTYIPFGNGPRKCIGQRFALLETKLALVKTITKFRFYSIIDTDIPIKFKTNQTNNFLQAKRLVVGFVKR